MEPRATDWYANLLWLDRRKCILLVHSTTLFAAFHPDVSKADLTPLAPFCFAVIEREVRAEGLPNDTFGAISADELVVGRTCSRSVLGTMADMRRQIEAAVDQAGALHRLDLAALNRSLRRIPFSAVKYARAIELTRALSSSPVAAMSDAPAATATQRRDRIDDALQDYLEEVRKSLTPKEYRHTEAIIQFFRRSLNSYSYQSLSAFERKRLEKAFDAGEEEAYTRLFGAEKIPGEVGSFVGDFMIRKVLGPRELIAAAGPVMSDLLDWLVEKNLVKPADILDAKERTATTGKDLPNAERLANALYDLAETSTLDAGDLADDDYVEDYLTISKVEPGKLWFEGGVGPLEVGHAVSRLAKPGWSVNIVLGRQRGRWQVLEVGNVYPG